MTTRADLNALCRRRLGDLAAPYTWGDLQLNQWINDAIADYSNYFPRELSIDVPAVAGQREYDLSTYHPRGVLSVEYPAGEDPPSYLRRRSRLGSGFWGGCYYDMIGDTLILGMKPSAGETIRVRYLADHAYPDDDADVITVPDAHLELLVLFVRWAAAQELEALEAQNPDASTLMLNQLSLATFRTERAYRMKLNSLLPGRDGAVVTWEGLI